MNRFRGWLPAFVGLLLLTACGPTPAPLASASDAPAGVQEISPATLGEHLSALDEIAAANGGVRTVGTAGYAASVEYVQRELEGMGYIVTTPAVEMTLFTELPGSTVRIDHGPTFDGGPDFRAMIYSGGGDVTARLATVGYEDSAGGQGARGCEAEDFAEFPEGAIALVAPGGNCFRRAVVMNAQAAGAAAVIGPNPLYRRGEVRRPTLFSPDIEIPALAASGPMGDALQEAAIDGAKVDLHVDVEKDPATVQNVVAETATGAPGRVVMLGGHLDSVHDGPGINDNGSGVAGLLEIARGAAAGVDGARLRFAFWAGEEYGLYGSRAYVEGLSDEERGQIVAYINLDMLGSPNALPFVYDDAGAATGSQEITDYLAARLEAAGIGSLPIDVGGASDHASFQDAGIPTGGLFSGATEIKTSEQAEQFGGTAGAPLDACYHLACDTAGNVDNDYLAALAEVAAAVALALARGDLLP